MKTTNQIDFRNKKVIIRCGFNVPIENNKVSDDTRIKAGMETIEFIKKQNPKLILLVSHLGRPKGKRVASLSNRPIARRLKRLIKNEVKLLDNLREFRKVLSARTDKNFGKIYLLENIRFWKEEKKNDVAFGKKIGKNFDIYVNDCFSTSHRAHASLVQFPKFTKEKCAGLLFERELNNLNKVKNNPNHPAVMVIGGAKIATKLPVIKNMLKKYDKILVGGLIANEALDDKLNLGEKVILPTDFSPANKKNQRLDIGPKTINRFIAEIEQAETIIWNGPMGKFEERDCAKGTKLIAQAVAKNKKSTQVIGGGETLEAVRQFSDFSAFDYISMSGGAMLEFLAGEELPGVKALQR